MSTFTKLTYHIVFSTKYREPLIRDSFQERLYKYMAGIIHAQNGYLVVIGGVEDHVHLLARFSPKRSFSDTIRDIKANSSKWANELPDLKGKFEWQKGYSAFTVSYSHVDTVCRYIQNQKEHHRVKSFTEEYTTFLKRHNIDFNPKYLFEAEYHA